MEETFRNCFREIVSESGVMKRVLEMALKVALTDAPVLIVGEPGSGRTSIARAIHCVSARRNESFVKIRHATASIGTLESRVNWRTRTPPISPIPTVPPIVRKNILLAVATPRSSHPTLV